MNYQDCETLDRDRVRANLLKYTRRAYEMLPRLDKPRILDIGCGTGVVTVELARLSDGSIVGVDIDEPALDKLRLMVRKHNLSGRVTVIHQSMLAMDFPPGSFDIIWAEGSISCIGFERGLKELRRLLVSEGYLVVHDELSDLRRKTDLIRICGFITLGQFKLPPRIWWNEYYAPLKEQLESLRSIDSPDKTVISEMKAIEREIKEFDLESDRFGSVFFVLRRT